MNKYFMDLLIKMLPYILAQVTPLIKDALWDAIYALEKKADETPNDADNLLVDWLKAFLGMPAVKP